MVDFNGIGKQVSQLVGTTAVALTSVQKIPGGLGQPDKVILQGMTTNRGSIIAKNESDVLATGEAGGFEIPPGGNIILPLADYKKFYVVATLANQRLQITFLGGQG